MATTTLSSGDLEPGNRLEQIRADLARKIAQNIGSAANKCTDVPVLPSFGR